MSKKEKEVVIDEVVEAPVPNYVETPSKIALKELIERYKEQNPKKYALKKDELEAKLKSL